LRLDGRFVLARERFGACSIPSCPVMIREDCTRRLRELDGAQPTIVFDVVGAVPSSVQVTVDGQPVTDRLDGSALRVDPGAHTFVFVTEGREAATLQLSIKEGQKDRRETVTLKAAALPPPSPAVVTVPSVAPGPAVRSGAPLAEPPAQVGPPSRRGMGPQRTAGLVVGGIGIAGLAVGGAFGVLTLSAVSQQKSDCATVTNCPQPKSADSEHSTAFTDGTVADVAMIGGGALLALGATLFFTAPGTSNAEAPRTTAGYRVGPWFLRPAVGPSGAIVLLGGSL
jgi:hypothetical protein